MPYFLDKILKKFAGTSPDAEIVGEPKLQEGNSTYLTVKMRGSNTLVDIDVEDIVERFTDKFSQSDIRNATKILMKYRSLLRLASLEKKFAIFFNNLDKSYQLVDLSDNLFLRNFDIDTLRAEDAFKLGVQFEKMRNEKESKLPPINKERNNITPFAVVESED